MKNMLEASIVFNYFDYPDILPIAKSILSYLWNVGRNNTFL
jgi:hypothetical protein